MVLSLDMNCTYGPVLMIQDRDYGEGSQPRGLNDNLIDQRILLRVCNGSWSTCTDDPGLDVSLGILKRVLRHSGNIHRRIIRDVQCTLYFFFLWIDEAKQNSAIAELSQTVGGTLKYIAGASDRTAQRVK